MTKLSRLFLGRVPRSTCDEENMSEHKPKNKVVNLLQEFSIPLISGVFAALIWANLDHHSYHEFLHHPLTPFSGINFHFLINDIFMVLFFGIAAVEITQSILPGGDLNPPKKAIGPLFATAGGVIGPALLYYFFCVYYNTPELVQGWGIPTATDIALAWLFARLIFGAGHVAVSFLLLLAIADDAIGLAIIAVFYPNPAHPPAPMWLGLVVLACLIAYFLRRSKVKGFWYYLLIPGVLSWFGLFKAGLHPALALVFIVPFMQAGKEINSHLFEEEEDDHSTLANFEHSFKTMIDFGLFGFGLANAGVSLSGVSQVTWFVFLALLVGKTAGIFLFALLAKLLKFPMPEGMGLKEVFVVGIIAGLGLTVALFVAGVAFTDLEVQGAAKMGALMSGGCGILAFVVARLLGIRPTKQA